jgi:hypothetical protein
VVEGCHWPALDVASLVACFFRGNNRMLAADRGVFTGLHSTQHLCLPRRVGSDYTTSHGRTHGPAILHLLTPALFPWRSCMWAKWPSTAPSPLPVAFPLPGADAKLSSLLSPSLCSASFSFLPHALLLIPQVILCSTQLSTASSVCYPSFFYHLLDYSLPFLKVPVTFPVNSQGTSN